MSISFFLNCMTCFPFPPAFEVYIVALAVNIPADSTVNPIMNLYGKEVYDTFLPLKPLRTMEKACKEILISLKILYLEHQCLGPFC